MKRSLLGVSIAAVFAMLVAGGLFLGTRSDTSALTMIAVGPIPGNAACPSQAAGGGQFLDDPTCGGMGIPCVVGGMQVGGIAAWPNAMAIYYDVANCAVGNEKAVLLTPVPAPDPLLQDGVLKQGFLLDLATKAGPWAGTEAMVQSVGVLAFPNYPDISTVNFLACGNVGGAPVVGWDGLLDAQCSLPPSFSASIDADANDGTAPCDPINVTSNVVVPGPHDVAVCVSNAPASLGVFSLVITYDPLLDSCPDINCGAGSCLDDNPNVNENALSGGAASDWDCNIMDLAEPTCQQKVEGSPQPGRAFLACLALSGPFASPVGSTFELATLSLNATALGDESVGLADVSLSDSTGTELGSCNPVIGVPMGCSSAVVHKIEPSPTPPPPPDTDLSVDLTGPAEVTVGGSPVYTAVVANNDDGDEDAAGSEDADAVVLVVTLPPTKPFVSADDASCTHDAGVVTCALGALAVGASKTVNITTGATTPGASVVSASVSETDGAPAESNAANNADSVTTNEVSAGVRMEKDCSPAEGVQTNCNLWVREGDPIPAEGKGCLRIEKWVFNAVDTDSSNDADEEPEGVGAWEERILWDHKILALSAEADIAWLESGGRIANCTVEILTENWIKTSCITMDDPATPEVDPGPNGSGLIEVITVCPQVEDLLGIGLRPTKDNGIVTDVVDDNCEVTDTLAEWIPGTSPGGETTTCGDAKITVRILQGDLDLDCDVDVVDEQAIAFRYGASLGLQLYQRWYDLEPKWTDYDIDVKDLQFVFGRDGSTCQDPYPEDQADPLP